MKEYVKTIVIGLVEMAIGIALAIGIARLTEVRDGILIWDSTVLTRVVILFAYMMVVRLKSFAKDFIAYIMLRRRIKEMAKQYYN